MNFFNFRNFIIFCIFVFGLCNGLLYIFEDKSVGHNKTRKICHEAISDNKLIVNNKKAWGVQNIVDWNTPNRLFFVSKTKDTLNYTNYIRPFMNSDIEIWHSKHISSKRLFILRKKVTKIIKNMKKCPNEPLFLLRTHLYCAIKKFMIEACHDNDKLNHYNEFSTSSILFLLAEKYNSDIRLRLLIEKNHEKNEFLYSISVIRTKRDINYHEDNFLYLNQQNFKIKTTVKNNKKFRRDSGIKKILRNFKPEKYFCDLKFYIQNDNYDTKFLNYLHSINSIYEDKNLPREPVQIVLAEDVIEKEVRKINQREEDEIYNNLQKRKILKKRTDASEYINSNNNE